MMRLAVFTFLLALALSGCSILDSERASEDNPDAVLLAFVDVSKSTLGKAGVQRARYLRAFEKILDGVPGGTLVNVDVIDSNPLASSSLPISVFFEEYGGPLSSQNESEVRAQNRRAAEQAVREFQKLLGRRPKGNSILDSLNIADTVFASYPSATTRYLVIFSDMIESSERYAFTRANLETSSVRSLLRRERAEGVIADLSGVDVYIVGAGGTRGADESARRFRSVRSFWLTYFAATGAGLPENRYGATLVRFP